MSRRLDQEQPSNAFLYTNFTPEADDRRRALAEYLGMSDSEFIRMLPREKRERLYREGKRPPLVPRGELKSFTGRRKLDGEFRMRKTRVAPTEKDAIVALSQYLDLPCNELITQLAEEKRAEVRRDGGNPPVKPRGEGGGQWAPRK